MQLTTEKGLDTHSAGAVATCDIRRYYDSLDPLLVTRFLVSKGCPWQTAICCLKLQMLPKVILNLLGRSPCVGSRCTGALTGSRTAGGLGTVPICDVLRVLIGTWLPEPFRMENLTLNSFMD